ncbi:hypothetical protein QCA50_014925 [Cerrena zonata]|uniref:Uncharacterized protein n=1 Tax=Cerrena zonata TaxID=2478898 RepID=A0AAW0FRQ6_9APHY
MASHSASFNQQDECHLAECKDDMYIFFQGRKQQVGDCLSAMRGSEEIIELQGSPEELPPYVVRLVKEHLARNLVK